MRQRKSTLFLVFLTAEMIFAAGLFFHAARERKASLPLLQERAGVVRRLALTDPALFTDARYSRHPSMADWSTPFQDYPGSLEHFPSGSLLMPPPHLASPHGLD
jgi:hypothetical protein